MKKYRLSTFICMEKDSGATKTFFFYYIGENLIANLTSEGDWELESLAAERPYAQLSLGWSCMWRLVPNL